jgi:hypothetical protein
MLVSQPTMTTPGMPYAGDPKVVSLGVVRGSSLAQVQQEQAAQDEAEAVKPSIILNGLAGHIKTAWSIARDAKQRTVEQRMLENMRARSAEYDPDKLAAIRAMGGTEIYAGLTAVKCRAAASWIRDVLMSSGPDRPWSLEPTPMPDLPPELNAAIVARVSKLVTASIQAGTPMDQDDTIEMMASLRTQVAEEAKNAARQMADKMADKMEDQLDEGGFRQALDQCIDDLTTFPSAILKGPILRRKPRIAWGQMDGGNYTPVVEQKIVMEWERVSPFDIYPSPGATNAQEGSLIERHRLTRADLQDMRGVKGYDDSAIDSVLEDYGQGGLSQWLIDDVQQAEATGQSTVHAATNSDKRIDALQYWGSVAGRTLRDWGMTKAQIPDINQEYQVEAWLVGSHVIRAVLNHDPLRRRPYYTASYEEVPGAWWGRSVADLVRDPQQACNAAMRALVNNMGMASGPQVTVNVDRLAPGETMTTLTPWRIWQVTTDPLGNQNAANPPINFYQPDSRAQELMAIYEKFGQMADEYSGVPRYLSGDTTGGAGRTASGLSMLIGNAAKTLKAVLGNIDLNVLEPMLERLYFHNMMYADDPDLKGDVNIVAHGSSAITARDAAQMRRNEFLVATANPIDMQIVGLEGRAAVLREVAKGLNMDVNKVVPSDETIKAKLAAQAAMPPPGGPPGGPPGLPTPPGPPGGTPVPPQGMSGSGQALMDHAPVVDHFGPQPKP